MMATQTNTTIYQQNEFMPNVYILIADKNSNGNALEMANLFYESDKFEFAEPDFIQALSSHCATDPDFSAQWGLKNTGQRGGIVGADINICKAWEITQGCNNIKIAVIDEGVELNHPDLQGNMLSGFDATDGNNARDANELSPHGTACAGIIAAMKDNGIGMVGVAPNCKIMPVRIGYEDNNPYTLWATNLWLSDGIMWACANGADILSNSWSSSSPSDAVTYAINNATTLGRNGLGCMVFFASGNDNSSVSYPANLPNTIAVGAINMCEQRKSPYSCDGETSWGSNYGNTLDFVMPGVKIQTTDLTGETNGYDDNNDYIANFNGTSAACPFAAGVAALVLSINPELTQSEARELLSLSCDKVGNYNYSQQSKYGLKNEEMGYGRINAYKAVRYALDVLTASYTGHSGVDQGSTDNFRWILNARGESGLAAGTYMAKRHEVKTTITYPYTAYPRVFINANGFSAANPNPGTYYTNVEVSETSATIKTWVYYVQYAMSGQQINRFVPVSPSDIRFNISVFNEMQDNIMLQNQIVGDGMRSYYAIDAIETSNYNVNGSSKIELYSGNGIRLNPGTHIYPNSSGSFRAAIYDRPTCGIETSYVGGAPRNQGVEFPVTSKNGGIVEEDIAITKKRLSNVLIRIFPNPNNGSFYLQTDCNSEQLHKIQIFNCLGQIVYESDSYNGDKIQLTTVSKGSFVLRAITNAGIITRKVIVQ